MESAIIDVNAKSGEDGAGCGSVSSPCRSLHGAFINAPKTASFVEIHMSAGLYADDCSEQGILFSTPLSIKGAGFGATVIDCGNKGRVLNGQLKRAGLAPAFSLAELTIRNGYSVGSGGAILVEGGIIMIEKCSFENCSSDSIGDPAIVHGGGAICSVSASMFVVNNSTFMNCSAKSASGGAILVTGGPSQSNTTQVSFPIPTETLATRSFRVSSSVFLGCKAAVAGGAVAVESILVDIRAGLKPWSPVVFEDSSFEHSQLTVSGSADQAWGAGVHVGYGQWDVGGNHLAENQAELAFQNISVTFNRTHFRRGRVVSDLGSIAGGIYLVSFTKQRHQSITIYNSTFTDNVLQARSTCPASNPDCYLGWAYQGGVSISYNAPVVDLAVSVASCYFARNQLTAGAAQNGGFGMDAFMGATNAIVSFSNTTFEDHRLVGVGDSGATGGGAGVYYAQFQAFGNDLAAVNVTTIFDSCVFQRNRLLATKDSGGGSFGAGIWLGIYGTAYENTKSIVTACKFVANEAIGLGDYKTTGASGAAIYISLFDEAAVEVHGSHFEGNFAERQGGAITVEQSSVNPALNLNMSATYLGTRAPFPTLLFACAISNAFVRMHHFQRFCSRAPFPTLLYACAISNAFVQGRTNTLMICFVQVLLSTPLGNATTRKKT
jgi:hypothetical protein